MGTGITRVQGGREVVVEHEEEKGEEVEAAALRPDMPAARPKSEGRMKEGR
jgi:hypothetical protein